MYLEEVSRGIVPDNHYGSSLDRDTGRFAVKYLRTHPERAQDPTIMTLFANLVAGDFWTPLSLLDGPANGTLYDPSGNKRFTPVDYDNLRAERRAWTAANFTGSELREMFDFITEHALNPTTTYGKPGFLRGHSTLLQHVVDKPGSIFADRISVKGRKTLVNGAFWEELGAASAPGVVNDILEDNSVYLDPKLASTFGDTYRRNRKDYKNAQIDMQYFSEEALNKYIRFVEDIYRHGDSSQAQVDVDDLVIPYLEAVMGPDEDDSFALRFGPKYDIDKGTITTPIYGVRERLADPFVQESLVRSESNRKAVARTVKGLLEAHDHNPENGFYILDAIGGDIAHDITRRIVKGSSDYERRNLEHEAKGSKSSSAKAMIEMVKEVTVEELPF